jgi:hypothetical protein
MEVHNLVNPRVMFIGHGLEGPYQEMPRRHFRVRCQVTRSFSCRLRENNSRKYKGGNWDAYAKTSRCHLYRGPGSL